MKVDRRKKLKITLWVVGIILVTLVFVCTQPSRDRKAFAKKVCTNLMTAGYINHQSECYFHDQWYYVIRPMFPPEDVDINYVITAMQGYEQISYRTRVSTIADPQDCSSQAEWTEIQYKVIGGILGYGVVDFTFCDGKLMYFYIHE